jgi:hypothetical protein
LITIATTLVTRKKDEYKPCHPPAWLVNEICARAQWHGIRHLEAIVETPVMLADGEILQRPGYDPSSGLFLVPSADFPAVPDRPTKDDARRAAEELLEVVCDFPFQQPSHRSAWLAALLTPFARFGFSGPSPLIAIDANTRGSGKSKLADSIGRIVYDRDLARMSAPLNDDECRKKVTSICLAGESLVLIDNVANTLGWASLDAALTGTTWNDRVLGFSEMTGAIPLNTCWFATGNNLVFAADTARRSLHIRLETILERPEDREDFLHKDLLGWVSSQRARFATAALTILRAYHIAGRPALPIKPWGSFEGWSQLVRNAVVWCGLPDPGATRQEVAIESDKEAQLLRLLLDAWQEVDPHGHGLTVNQAITAATEQNALMRAAVAEFTPPNGQPNSRSMGMKLHHLKGRVSNGRRFGRADSSRNHAVWRIESVGEQTGEEENCGTTGTTGTKTSPGGNENDNCFRNEISDSRAARAQSSPASPCSPALACDHLSPASWVRRDGSAYCACCDKFMGRVSP